MSQERNNNGIDYIEFSVTDMEEAKSFYGDVFGWTFQDWGPDYASFNDGRIDGGLRKVESLKSGSPLVIFYSVDLKNIRDKIESTGCPITQDIFEFPGGKRFHFNDPFGNELAVWSEPK
ncbi:VOC family protein [Acidobacteriota bacterium]